MAHLFIPTPIPGSILAMLQLRAKTKSLTCPPLSIARYSFIQLSQLGRQWRERKSPIFETVTKGDSNPGPLDCESGILPLSYSAPQVEMVVIIITTINTFFVHLKHSERIFFFATQLKTNGKRGELCRNEGDGNRHARK